MGKCNKITRIILVGFISSIFSFTLKSQPEILWVKNFNSVRSSFFLDSKYGWVSDISGLFITTDGGSSWVKSVANQTYPLKLMRFLDRKLGFAIYSISPSNKVLVTIDGGHSWRETEIDFSINSVELLAIEHIDSLRGYVWGTFMEPTMGGQGNFVATTSDAWLSYSIQTILGHGITSATAIQNYLWVAIKKINANQDKVCDLLRSTDSGYNWSSVYTEEDCWLFSGLSMMDFNNGWMILRERATSRNEILKTTNGGENWSIIPIEDDVNVYDLDFLNIIDGFLVGEKNSHSLILRTTNGGLSWWEEDFYSFDALHSVKAVSGNKIYLTTESDFVMALQVDNLHPPFYNMLKHNYPNPFNSITLIKYEISDDNNVVLKVFDILGHDIITLINENQSGGLHSIYFDASGLPSGIYFYQLRAGNFIETKKMVLLK